MSRMEEAILKNSAISESMEGSFINKRRFALDMIGFLIARAAIFNMNPLGIGYFAVSVGSENRVGLYFMMILGMATTGNINETVRYAGVISIIWASTLFYKSVMKKKEINLMAIGCITAFSVVVSYILQAIVGVDGMVIGKQALIEGLPSIIAGLLFYMGVRFVNEGNFSEHIDNESLISLVIIMSSALLGVRGIEFMQISFLEIAAFSCILIGGYRYGAGTGAVIGAVAGAVVGYDVDQVMIYLGAYCVLGIFAGTFRKLGRFVSVIGMMLAILLIGNLFLPQLFEIGTIKSLAIAVAALLLAPSEMIERVQLFVSHNVGQEKTEELLRQMTEERMEKISGAFTKLSNTLKSQMVTKEDVSYNNSKLVNEIQANVCNKCIQCKKCWIDNYYNIYSSMHQLLHESEDDGKVNMLTIPDILSNRCIRLGKLIEEVNKIISESITESSWKQKVNEHKEVVAMQLDEIGNIISDFSDEIYKRGSIEKNLEKAIRDRLKNINVIVDGVSIIGNDSFRNEIYIIGKTYKKRSVTTREIAGVLSEIYGRRVIPAEGARSIMTRNGGVAKFIEDTHFKTLQAISKVNKNGETVSGDNFAFMHLGGGRLVSVLADGMGSGEKACKESEVVIDLLESLMNAGFKEKAAIKLINSVLILRGMEDNFSTVDMSITDLYTGVCEFVKLGAATTFIKRDNWVETIKSTTLPVGIIQQVDYDQTTKKLYDGDVIVMVTDGVLDTVNSIDKEKFIEEVLLEKESNNPQEIADYLMRRVKMLCNDAPKDDMTILAVEIMKRP